MERRVFIAGDYTLVSELDHVAIAITSVRNKPGQHHVGVLHKDESSREVRMLHLAWHNQLRNSVPKTSYAWVVPPIPKRRARQVAAFCRKVHRANISGIPYAFSLASDCFDEQTGAFLVGPERLGLTCASFVLGIFHSTGLPLLQYDTWPKKRDGDEEWQRRVIENLKQSGASQEHIQGVESELGAIRYRPEDVAGAGASESIPASFDEANLLSIEILGFLIENDLFS
ncbi:MAG TPA: hypothetical protein VHC44_07765 [Verrucomicrobiae bacterium]|nr:hypothetical protein [Verrucomicrobiae bacterium]